MSKKCNYLCSKSWTFPLICAFFFSSHSPSAVVSCKDSLSIHGDPLMDLRVPQRFLYPGPDSAMLAPHPPFFLGHLTSQNCSQLTQQHLQVGKEKSEVGPVTSRSSIMYTKEGVGSLFCVEGEKAEGAHQLWQVYLRCNFSTWAQLLCGFKQKNQHVLDPETNVKQTLTSVFAPCSITWNTGNERWRSRKEKSSSNWYERIKMSRVSTEHRSPRRNLSFCVSRKIADSLFLWVTSCVSLKRWGFLEFLFCVWKFENQVNTGVPGNQSTVT